LIHRVYIIWPIYKKRKNQSDSTKDGDKFNDFCFLKAVVAFSERSDQKGKKSLQAAKKSNECGGRQSHLTTQSVFDCIALLE
jgi:hypothetical protein